MVQYLGEEEGESRHNPFSREPAVVHFLPRGRWPIPFAGKKEKGESSPRAFAGLSRQIQHFGEKCELLSWDGGEEKGRVSFRKLQPCALSEKAVA